MKSLILIAGTLLVALNYTDLESESSFRSLLLPIVDFVLFCCLAIWVAGRTGWRRIDGAGGGSGGFFDGGGDGGGCD